MRGHRRRHNKGQKSFCVWNSLFVKGVRRPFRASRNGPWLILDKYLYGWMIGVDLSALIWGSAPRWVERALLEGRLPSSDSVQNKRALLPKAGKSSVKDRMASA